MRKILILYQSKYGATKRYAEMLKRQLGCDVCESRRAPFGQLEAYDTVVAAGGVYAGGIAGLPYIRKNLTALAGKRLAVLAVGASPFDERAVEELKVRALSGLPKDTPLFYARGTYDEGRMHWLNRTLCRMLKNALRKRDPAEFEPWMQALYEAEGQSADWVDQAYLAPLLGWLNA